MALSFNFEEDVLVVYFEKNTLDSSYAVQFKEELSHLIQTCHFPFVILHLEPLQFIDSSGLAALFSSLRILSSHDRDLLIVKLNHQIAHVFEQLGMQKIFSYFPSVEAAKSYIDDKKKNLIKR